MTTSFRVAFALALLGLVSNAQTTTVTDKLFDPAPVAFINGFGSDVAISGERMIVGAFTQTQTTTYLFEGAAHVFVRTPAGWAHEVELTAPDPIATGWFGYDVELEGTRAVSLRAHGQPVSTFGAVYVHERDASGWSLAAKLVPSAPLYLGSIALDGDRIAVGAPFASPGLPEQGVVSIFDLGPGGWSEVAVLSPNAPIAQERFGASVALEGNRLIVGAAGETSVAGSVYVFERIAGTWTQQARLAPPGADAGDRFGLRVALRGDVAVATAQGTDAPFMDSGTAYVLERTSLGWIFGSVLVPRDPVESARFGRALAFDGETILIGAAGVGIPTPSGAAYAFRRAPGGAWVQAARFVRQDDASSIMFGRSVALGDGLLAFGDESADGAVPYMGAVYVHETEAWLAGDVTELSVATGGTQSFALDAGADHAGSVHLLLGSASGTTPGVTIDGLVLPLNIDSYLIATLVGPNQPPLASSLGVLDASGSATAALTVPAGAPPALVGLQLAHAYLVLDAQPSPLAAVSNPVAVDLLP